jgi:hypothetical protein
MMIKRNTSLTPALLILATFMILSGCYTILNHPPIETTYEAEEYTSCYDCHDSAVYSGYYSPMAYPHMWSEYYAVPWWHNDIHIYDGDPDGVPTRSVISDRIIRMRNDDMNTSPVDRRSVAPMIRTGSSGSSDTESGARSRSAGETDKDPKRGSAKRYDRKARTRRSGGETKERKKDDGRDRPGS